MHRPIPALQARISIPRTLRSPTDPPGQHGTLDNSNSASFARLPSASRPGHARRVGTPLHRSPKAGPRPPAVRAPGATVPPAPPHSIAAGSSSTRTNGRAMAPSSGQGRFDRRDRSTSTSRPEARPAGPTPGSVTSSSGAATRISGSTSVVARPSARCGRGPDPRRLRGDGAVHRLPAHGDVDQTVDLDPRARPVTRRPHPIPVGRGLRLCGAWRSRVHRPEAGKDGVG